ncbi:MAG: hypothetical protein K5917_00725 [Clostridiales bacterium]|nr:hypothetical protein [Clostridiales bacterium]
MISFRNCTMNEAVDRFSKRRIIPFGTGLWFNYLQYTDLRLLNENYVYAIDNNLQRTEVEFCNRRLPVRGVDSLLRETDAVVIITSPIHMYDMYTQLSAMNLPDTIECYALPFVQLVSDANYSKLEERRAINCKNLNKIPKIIHCFWFSGDEKPESYKRCFDTWKKVCPDYQIIEWSKDNYDYKKNEFCKKAIELGAWAFASDFARLDVVHRMGGFYMDMDVELLKPLDDFLGNEGVFSFSNNITVDLAVFGAAKGNVLVKKLLDLYSKVDIPNTRKEFDKCFQPNIILPTLLDYGLKCDGSFQIVEKNAFLPRCYFMPMDLVLFELAAKNERTYAIHWDNFGWYSGGNDTRKNKEVNNRKLWAMLGE